MRWQTKAALRFFSTSQQKQLNEMKDKNQSVELQNCQIKKSIRDSDKLEVLLKGATKILPSSKEFVSLHWNMMTTSQRK